MDITIVSEFIKNTGFPIFVALFVLFRMEPMIRALKDALVVQTVVLSKVLGVDYETVKKMMGDCADIKVNTK